MNDYTIISPPFENQTTAREGEAVADTPIAIFTAGTTHAVNAIPGPLIGSMVRVKVVGGTLYYHFSDNASGEVDSSQTGAAGGNVDPTVGFPLADGEWEDVMCSGKYFVREASASCNVWIRRA